MDRIEVPSERGGYVVCVGCGVRERLADLLAGPVGAVVTDVTVAPLYGRRLAAALSLPAPIELPEGESAKTVEHVREIARALLARGVTRSDRVVAVGGGVVTDTAGFVASVYQRGIGWVAVPTTLLAMVDAAVGGKTGVNLDEGKNLLGTFWPPELVVADVATLATLAERELRAGLAEVVKAAWIGDRALLALVRRPVARFDDLEPAAWEHLVLRAVRVKAEVVAADERESGRRRALNLGHTLGHALEAATGYTRFVHGEAVALGLVGAAWLGRRRGLLSGEAERELCGAVVRLGPFPSPPPDDDDILRHVAYDKKRGAGGVGWVLPTDDGVVLDEAVSGDEIRGALAAVRRAAAAGVR